MYGTTTQPVDPLTHIQMEHARAQRNFAMMVFVFAFFLLLVVSLGALSGEKSLEPQMVFTTITTLVGTWVGTLLAFFYSRENFESASRSVQNALNRMTPDEKLVSISAEDAMVPFDQMTVVSNADPETITLDSLKAEFNKDERVTRLPILRSDNSVFAIVHEGTLDKYRAAHPAATGATLRDLLQDPDGARAKVLLFLNRRQSLRDAHAALQLIRDAKDVFVTETGAGKEPILGWITDSTVIDKMKS